MIAGFCPAPRTEAGFASFVILSGSSSTAMFFLIPLLGDAPKKSVVSLLVLACALLAAALYGPATGAHEALLRFEGRGPRAPAGRAPLMGASEEKLKS